MTDTRTEEAGTARLRKYVVTEQQQVSVPVEHEEVRLQREPITDANVDDAYDGPSISEAEHEVTLHAERPVVETEAVSVERVRLGKETVFDITLHEERPVITTEIVPVQRVRLTKIVHTDEHVVSGRVRKEQIEADLPGQPPTIME